MKVVQTLDAVSKCLEGKLSGISTFKLAHVTHSSLVQTPRVTFKSAVLKMRPLLTHMIAIDVIIIDVSFFFFSPLWLQITELQIWAFTRKIWKLRVIGWPKQ